MHTIKNSFDYPPLSYLPGIGRSLRAEVASLPVVKKWVTPVPIFTASRDNPSSNLTEWAVHNGQCYCRQDIFRVVDTARKISPELKLRVASFPMRKYTCWAQQGTAVLQILCLVAWAGLLYARKQDGMHIPGVWWLYAGIAQAVVAPLFLGVTAGNLHYRYAPLEDNVRASLFSEILQAVDAIYAKKTKKN